MMLKSGPFARMNGKGSGSQVGKENLPTHRLNTYLLGRQVYQDTMVFLL